MLTYIKNAKIYKMQTMQRYNETDACGKPDASSMICDGKYIAYVGDEKGAEEYLAAANAQAGAPGVDADTAGCSAAVVDRAAGNVTVVDAEGKMLMPGFNDSHMHYLHYVKAKLGTDLNGSTSLKEVMDRMKNFFENDYDRNSGLWVSGEGWCQDYFTDEKRFPTKHDLDKITTDYPMIIMRVCFHIGVLNSKALEVLGINKYTVGQYGSYAEIDPDGSPNGVVKEALFDEIKGRMPSLTIEKLAAKMEEYQKDFFEKGITSVQTDDYLYVPSGQEYDMMRLLRAEAEAGRLKIRYAQQALLPTPAETDEFFNKQGFDASFGNDTFRIPVIKLLADGSLGARTAFMRKPYADDPSTCGIPIYTQEALNVQVLEAHRHNMPAIIHAIGDGAIEMCLNAIENARKTCPHLHPRHGIVHCQITDARQLERFKELDVCAYVQPVFIDYDMNIVRDRVGDELTETSYAWRTYIESGVHTAFGTDCPVEKFDPMRGIYCAVTQKGLNGSGPFLPQQKVSRLQALYSYTAEGAYMSGEEHVKGRLLPGYFADFIILDTDLMTCSEEDILNAKVEAAYIGGEKVY